MRLVYLSAIATGLVIVLGVAIVVPAIPQTTQRVPYLKVMLAFSIIDNRNTPEWCSKLSSLLKKHDAKASIFITGSVAEKHPECVTLFDKDVDIGSQTQNYVNLALIPDYIIQLDEVRNGKKSIDRVGNLDSRLFRAPYGATDNNIYSILNRSGIIADFSYRSQYNKYYADKFLRFDIVAYDGPNHDSAFFKELPLTNVPVLIYYDNHDKIEKIEALLSDLKSPTIRFVSASELTGIKLTIRKEN